MIRPSHWPSRFRLWLCNRAAPDFVKQGRAKLRHAKRTHGKISHIYAGIKSDMTDALRKEVKQ